VNFKIRYFHFFNMLILPFALAPSLMPIESISMIRITIIEDNKYMREGWKTMLDFEHDMQVIGSFVSCEQAFDSGIMDKTDIVLMDINLPGISRSESVV